MIPSRSPMIFLQRGLRRVPWFAGLVHAAAGLVGLLACAVLGDLVWRGGRYLSWSFLATAPVDAGRAGGAGPMIVTHLLVLAVCLATVLPVGLGTAIWLTEFVPADARRSIWLRRMLHVLAGAPSIVFGLLGNALFCRYLGFRESILSGGLTLACMVLPVLTQGCETALLAVPGRYRFAAAAVGMSQGSILLRVVLPLATPGIVGGLLVALGRAAAETSALILTCGLSERWPTSLFDSGRTLSVHIYVLATDITGGEAAAAAAALVLAGVMLLIQMLSAWCTRRLLNRSGKEP